MARSTKKIIAFDLDDTLYKEMDFVKSGLKKVADHVGVKFSINKKEFYSLLLRILEKKGRGCVFDLALKKYNIYKKETISKLVKIYRGHKQKIKPYSGVPAMLRRLEKAYKIILITDGDGAVQRNKVASLNIEKLFDAIIYTSDYGRGKEKPSIFSFEKILKKFKKSPDEMIYIGDDPNKDFFGAKKIGIKTIRVFQGKFKDLKTNKNYDADYKVNRILDVENIIHKINI